MTEILHQLEPHALSPEASAVIVGSEVDVNPNVQRAIDVEHAIDPEGVLPEVEIVPDPAYRTPSGRLVAQQSLIMHNGNQVGKCTVITEKKHKTRWFNGIEVDTKGQGFGSAAYKAAIVDAMGEGLDFQTHDYSQSASAAQVWQRLAECGVATIERPFTPAGGGRYDGKYVVKSAETLHAKQE